jgi:TatD DNase family protein
MPGNKHLSAPSDASARDYNGGMKISLIDIGSNLTHDSFAHDRDAVIASALEAGVRHQVVTGADVASSIQAAALAAAHPAHLSSTAGVHPHHAQSFDAAGSELSGLLRRPEVVAVGECGLDYYRDFSPREVQRQAFHRQLERAAEVGKPVFLHQRDAHADFIAILREHGARHAGVAHCFTAGGTELAHYLELGLAIGITGWICDERRGSHLAPLMRAIPAERLLLETDGPYLLPRDLKPAPRTRRNEPAFLSHIAARVAHERGESLATLAQSSSAAARALFRLPLPAGEAAEKVPEEIRIT